MARLASMSGDSNWYPTTGFYFAEGSSIGTTQIVSDTTVARWAGGTSIKCVGGTTATSYLRSDNITYSNSFSRMWFRVSVLPTTSARILAHHDAGALNAHMLWVVLTSAGKLQLWGTPSSPAQIGSDSAATIAVNTWYCIQTQYFNNSTASPSQYGLLLDGESVASTSYTEPVARSLQQYWLIGWVTAPGTTSTMWIDDLAVNDIMVSSAKYENSYPNIQGRVLFLPFADVVSNIGWATCKNTTTSVDIITALNRWPPEGHSDSTNDTVSHQIRNTTATSQFDPAWLVVRCQSYGRAGVGGNVYLEPGAATYSAFGNTAARTKIGQGFYLNGTLELCRLWLRKQGTPTDTITLSLCSDSSGVPGSVLQNVTLNGSTLSTTATAIDLAMLSEPLTPKTKYWLTLERVGANDASNYYQIETCADMYRDGGESLYTASWGAATVTVAWHMRLYSTEGATVINSMLPLIVHGEGASPGTKTGYYGLLTPNAGNITFTFGDDLGATGAFPTNWATPQMAIATQHVANAIIPNAAASAVARVAKIDSGTRSGIVASMAIQAEWVSVEGMWLQFTKIAGGATWYGKHTARSTIVSLVDETDITVDAGDWIMIPAMLGETDAFPTTTISVTDTTLRTDYTLVGPAG